ncbi:MAG TPA: hypothetical protein VNR39_03640, partial [Pseudolabrys sp.]|nr:hypothetical protein [Pseudolabrys sp.]
LRGLHSGEPDARDTLHRCHAGPWATRRPARSSAVPGFTRKYGVRRLVYVELYEQVVDAIVREKQLKGWNRLIERVNPHWNEISAADVPLG